jgi:hypothetical protein
LAKSAIIIDMTNQDLASLRLANQQISHRKFSSPEALVSYFGAMQSQDFAAAKWAVGLRIPGSTDTGIEEAFNTGKILRTHIMRPTWHFVSPEDIRWILELTSPRLHAFNGYYYRKSGFTKEIFQKSNQVITKALQGGKKLIRTELKKLLDAAKIPTQDVGLSYALMQAEIDGLICSGPRIGKQFSYMLLEERVTKTKKLSNDESLAKLTLKYFTSHGPATIADFSWWSGLTQSEIKKGLELNKPHLEKIEIEKKTYWFAPETLAPQPPTSAPPPLLR